MKNFKTIAAMLLVSISSTFTFTSCKDDVIDDNKKTNEVLTRGAGDGQDMKKAYGLTYHNFISKNDVQILNADTTEISVSKALAEKLGIQTFTGHAMGIWDDMSHLPYARKATAEKLVGDRYILTVVPATVAELIGENKVTLNTAVYFNPNVQGGQTRAGIEMPAYAAKYIDENDIIHPAMVHLTDPYGYDQDYYTDEDQPKAGTRSSGEYQFITGEDLAQGTRFSVNRNILSFHKKLEKEIKIPCGKSGGDNAKMTLKAPVDFDLNYFLTLEGGWSWKSFKVYCKKFETGLDGNFAISPEVRMEMHKEWALDANKHTYKIANFHGYTFTFMVGIVPVVVKCNPNMYARIDGKVTADFKAGFKYEYGSKFKGGLSYTQDNGWNLIKEFKEEKNVFTFYKPEAEVHAEAGVGFYIGVDVLLYGVAGPSASVGPRLSATADLKATAWKDATLDLKAKAEMTINAEVGAKLTILGYDIAEYKKNFELGGPWVLWQYPSTGNEHQVGKVYTPEEQFWMDMSKFIDEANNIGGTPVSLKQMIDELSDMTSQERNISKEEAYKQLIKSNIKDAFRDVNKVPQASNDPKENWWRKTGELTFRNSILNSYNIHKEWFKSEERKAFVEFGNILKENDQVKPIAAAHPKEIDTMIIRAINKFKESKGSLPMMNKEDMNEMVRLIVAQAE